MPTIFQVSTWSRLVTSPFSDFDHSFQHYLPPIQAYFARIEEVNLQGPQLRAVLELNPSALGQAAVLDQERKLKGKRSDLHGIPILLKVNFLKKNK